jgi:hypothetical protein
MLKSISGRIHMAKTFNIHFRNNIFQSLPNEGPLGDIFQRLRNFRIVGKDARYYYKSTEINKYSIDKKDIVK